MAKDFRELLDKFTELERQVCCLAKNQVTDTNIGTNDLTLSSNRILNGDNYSKNLTIEQINYLTLSAIGTYIKSKNASGVPTTRISVTGGQDNSDINILNSRLISPYWFSVDYTNKNFSAGDYYNYNNKTSIILDDNVGQTKITLQALNGILINSTSNINKNAILKADNLNSNTIYQFPTVGGTLARSINGNIADIAGNIALTLNQLSNTNISSPTNGQVLTYNSSTSKWVNSTSSSSGPTEGTYTPTFSSVDSSITSIINIKHAYIRNGNTVTVYGQFRFNKSATGSAANMIMSLPIAANNTSVATGGVISCRDLGTATNREIFFGGLNNTSSVYIVVTQNAFSASGVCNYTYTYNTTL